MTTAAASSNALFARADLLLLLADGFRSPAEARLRLADLSPADLSALVQAANVPDSSEVLSALDVFLHTMSDIDTDAWSDEFHRLFEGAMACPLNETAFIRRDKGAIIGDLAAFYRAFGWAPRRAGEKPDHLLAEIEFLAVLLTMAAQARVDQQATADDVTQKAIDSFVTDHLGDWIVAVSDHLATWSPAGYFRALASATRIVWKALAGAHGWIAGGLANALCGVAARGEDDSPYECGAPDIDRPVPLYIGGSIPRDLPRATQPNQMDT